MIEVILFYRVSKINPGFSLIFMAFIQKIGHSRKFGRFHRKIE